MTNTLTLFPSKKECIFTIIAPNYVPQATILIESISKHIESANFFLILVQDCENVEIKNSLYSWILERCTDEINLNILTLSDIKWEDERSIYEMVNKYSLLEFCTAIKPSIFLHLFGEDWSQVTYLDPDILITHDFRNEIDLLADINLTPHIFRDYPDEYLPNLLTILNAGLYNLGFISANQNSSAAMKWWASKLIDGCYMDIGNGMHVDQKWIDFMPLFVKSNVIKSPGLNMAYWNLHERKLQYRNNQLFVVTKFYKKVPLSFFHFSGFINKNKLSKHSTRPKIKKSDWQLVKLINFYEKKLKKYCGEFNYSHCWSLGGRSMGQDLEEYIRMFWKNDFSKFRLRNGNFRIFRSNKRFICKTCGAKNHNFLNRSHKFLLEWSARKTKINNIILTNSDYLDNFGNFSDFLKVHSK